MYKKSKNPTSEAENVTLDVEVEMFEQVNQGIGGVETHIVEAH